jgi:hypothetical protein
MARSKNVINKLLAAKLLRRNGYEMTAMEFFKQMHGKTPAFKHPLTMCLQEDCEPEDTITLLKGGNHIEIVKHCPNGGMLTKHWSH